MSHDTFFVHSINEILSRIRRVDGRPFVVCIDGPGGSGKSTLARELAVSYGDGVAVVEGDDFYADLDEDYRAGLDAEAGYNDYFDWQRLRDQVLQPARQGREIRYQRYDWVNGRMGNWLTVPDVEVVLVEGVYSSRPETRDLADLTVWVTTSEDERVRRQAKRSENEEVWIERWMAAERHYLTKVQRGASSVLEVAGE